MIKLYYHRKEQTYSGLRQTRANGKFILFSSLDCRFYQYITTRKDGNSVLDENEDGDISKND